MVKCSHCGEEVESKQTAKLVIEGKTHHFHFHHIKSLTQRILSGVVLSKTFAEVMAIGTGIGGIIYTLMGFADRALIMDTLSALAAITALIVGIEHLRYLKEHGLLGRATLLLGAGILITIAILVWHFGFNLNNI